MFTHKKRFWVYQLFFGDILTEKTGLLYNIAVDKTYILIRFES